MVKKPRRFGREDSETRAWLLDVTEKMMREQGYAAVTSRTLAVEAGVKPALVHYYFRTMDDLFVALLRDRGGKAAEFYQRELSSTRPLRALWKLNSSPVHTANGAEFMALANHRKIIRAELASYAQQIRSLQMALITRALQDRVTGELICPPAAVATVMELLARGLTTHQSLGITLGHRETLAVAKRYLRNLESRARPVTSPRSTSPRARKTEKRP